MCINGKYCCLELQVTYDPEIHRTSMYTEYTYYKRYVIAYEKYKTYMIFENNAAGRP